MSTNSVETPLEWAREHTPLLREFTASYGDSRPFEEYTIAVASHLEAKTGVFIETLAAAGAEVLVTSSEPFSIQPTVVEALRPTDGIKLFVEAEMSQSDWAAEQHELLRAGPDFIIDDGCELITKLHADHPDRCSRVRGGAEQTTAGIHRLEAMAADDVLSFPVYGVNDTPMKHFFDNVHGTGESALANLMLTTNTMLAGETVVVAGYGYCGRGVARKARAFGAKTIVTEVDPRKALEAHMDGHRIMEMQEAASEGDYFITTTGTRDVLRREHFEHMANGTILANAGHFDVEIDVDALADLAERTRTPRPGIEQYVLPDGRRLNLLADGRLVNLTGPFSQGHPAEVMDMTFAMMFMAAHDLLTRDHGLSAGLHAIPDRLDRQVANRKLDTLGLSIDSLTDQQRAYQQNWEHPDMEF